MKLNSILVGMVTASSVLLGALTPAAAQQVTLNFLTAEPPEVYEEAIAAFEAANPDIDVAYERVPFDAMNAQIEARLGAEDPSIDVYAVDSPRVPAMASRGYLVSAEPWRDEIDAVTNEAGRSAILVGDEYMAFPLWSSTQMMFYNADLLEAAGLPVPSAAEADRLTWAETLDMAVKAQEAGAEWGLILEQIDRYYQLQALFESSGAGSGLTGDDLMTPNLTTDAWIETANWYRDTFENGISPRGVPNEQLSDLFINGKVAFYVGGPWNFDRFTASDVNYGITAHPYFEGGTPVTPTGSWAVGISPFTDQMDAAVRFIKFISLDPEGSYMTVESLPIPPVNLGAFDKYIERIAGFDPVIGPMAEEVMAYELANSAVARPRSKGYVAFEEILNRAFSDIRNGAEAQPSLEAAQQQLISTLSRL